MRNVVEIPSRVAESEKKSRFRVTAYCRVSTLHEEQDSSIELQIIHYENEIDRNPGWINAGIFFDRASGLKKKQTQFDAMIKKCRAGKIDLVLTKSISRFGRNTLSSLRTLQKLDTLGVDVYFEKENLWLHQKEMQMMITMLLAFAQAESESMSRNIKWRIRKGFGDHRIQ